MRVLIAGNIHDPLTPAQEKDVRQFSAEESVQGMVLPADEATKAQAGQIKLVLMIFWGIIAIIAAIIASDNVFRVLGRLSVRTAMLPMLSCNTSGSMPTSRAEEWAVMDASP